MCGIVGCYGPPQGSNGSLLQRMSDRLIHRGPDDAGIWHGEGLGMAHRRLSILDLSAAGSQPMASQSGRWILCYNGEIYNYRELKQRLPDLTWRGHSDTEVLVEAIERWGVENTVKQCVGMFAFAAYDTRSRELWLVRDRLGIKPLFYGWVGQRFVFASELGPFGELAGELAVDRASVRSFLRYGYVPAPYSIYHGVNKLPGGHLLCVPLTENRRTESEPSAYWRYQDYAQQPVSELNEQQAIDGLHARIRTAVSDRLISDVPIGAFLSGGYDSSLICAVMQEQMGRPVNTFTMGFENAAHNEAGFAKEIARHIGTDHTELYVSQSELLGAISKLPALCDEPVGDSSILPTYLVSELARRHVTVALSGDGGDELFWGYSRYTRALNLWRQAQRLPPLVRRSFGRFAVNALVQRLTRHISVPGLGGQPGPLHQKLARAAGIYGASSDRALYHQLMCKWRQPDDLLEGPDQSNAYSDEHHWCADLPAERRMAAQDLLVYLPDDILTKVDRASMAVSLEARVPLLDHRVVEYAARLPDQFKRRDGHNKYILRQVLNRYVPSALTDRPKMGFGVPMEQWLRGPLRELAETHLSASAVQQTGLLDPKPIRDLWHDHVNGRRNNASQLWIVIVLQMWISDRGLF
ncbi:MAG: asparagine synthase (glutamine-hydrolyzing) [Pseudomonadota bacterium]